MRQAFEAFLAAAIAGQPVVHENCAPRLHALLLRPANRIVESRAVQCTGGPGTRNAVLLTPSFGIVSYAFGNYGRIRIDGTDPGRTIGESVPEHGEFPAMAPLLAVIYASID